MTNDEKHIIRFDTSKTTMPEIGGTLTDAQRAEVEVWTHVPPFDGFTLQLEGTGGVMGAMHRQMLIGFRGTILSELITIEYLLAAVPLTDKLKDETDFSVKFWAEMNNNSRMFSQKLGHLRTWIDGQFIHAVPENFDSATELLLDVRNSLAHYPVQAAFNGTDDTLTPFVYRASKSQMFIFDQHKIVVMDTWLSLVKKELQAQFNQLNHARNANA